MDESKANKRKVVKRATGRQGISGYIKRYRQELKEVNMTKKYTNKALKKQLNIRARLLRLRIKLLNEIEDKLTLEVSSQVRGYYEKYGFEGVLAVLEAYNIFPSYNFLTINAVLDYTDWRLNKNF